MAGKEELKAHEIEPVAKDLILSGKCEIVVVSMGALGAMLISKENTFKAEAPIVKRKTTVGAGDSMVAGIVFYISKGKSLNEALQFGVACGTAATLNPGTGLCKIEDVERLIEQIENQVNNFQVTGI